MPQRLDPSTTNCSSRCTNERDRWNDLLALQSSVVNIDGGNMEGAHWILGKVSYLLE